MLTRFENARVFTGCDTKADAFVVEKGRFVFVGRKEDALKNWANAERIDLGGQFVCPGFCDSHIHLLSLGSSLMQAQMNKTSLAEALEALALFAAAHPEESFIVGRGFNQDLFEDVCRFLTRDDLDAVCPDRPCLVRRVCGHVATANTAALRLAGIDTHAVFVDGGEVVTDADGRPTGVLSENAIELVSSLIPTPDRHAIKERLLAAMECVRSYGITSVHSDDLSTFDIPFEEIIAAYMELKAEGRMSVRVYEQCLLPMKEALERFLQAGYCTGWGDDLFRIGPLKLLADGSLGARTAYMREPYADDPQNRGIATYSQEALNAMILRAHSAGMQIAVHAIGDAACDMVLDAYEAAQAQYPRHDARHGIVHAQITNREQIARMKKLGIHAYIQSIFLDYDSLIVHGRIGTRAQEAYPAASLLKNGVTLSNGSDSPVEPPFVLAGIQCAVTRLPYTRKQADAYLPAEALSLSQAITSYTAGSAFASGQENTKGLIHPGYLADFTVLRIDPFETDPEYLHRIPVSAVYMGGKQTR